MRILVVIVGDLTTREIASRLESRGLPIRTGPYVSCVRSNLSQIAEGIAALYADFPVEPSVEFSDFDVNVVGTGGLRRWLFPRAYFLLRGEANPVLGWFPQRLALTFFEWGMNYAIYGQLHSSLILHGAVLERDGRALIIMGDSGAGKSTLCAALMLSGWRLLTDELGLVDLKDGMIAPLVRPVSLKNASIKVIREFSPEVQMGPICQTIRKGAVAHVRPPVASVRKMNERAVPAWVVFVQYQSNVPFQIEEILRTEAFQHLARGAFNYYGLGETGFHVLCGLLDRVVCRRLTYSSLTEAVAHFNSNLYAGGSTAAG